MIYFDTIVMIMKPIYSINVHCTVIVFKFSANGLYSADIFINTLRQNPACKTYINIIMLYITTLHYYVFVFIEIFE